MMKKHLVMAVVPLLALGCGKDPEDANGDGVADGIQDPNNVSVVVPATPKGTVSGQVLNTRYTPLEGATVAMTIGSQSAAKTVNTDASGNFMFTDVPGGAQVLLTITRDGYAPLRTAATVPTTAGNVPINNGNANIGAALLGALDGTVKFGLVGPTGRPAAGAKAFLTIDTTGRIVAGNSNNTSSMLTVEAEAGADGVLTFERVPSPMEMQRLGSYYNLIVNAMDANGDGVYETGGIVRSYSGSDVATAGSQYITPQPLPFAYDPGLSLSVNYTNVQAFKGGPTQPQYNMIRSGEPIYLTFNQPVQPNSVVVQMTDEYGRESLAVNKAFLQGNTVLSITPTGSVVAGQEYNLYVRAASLSGTSSINDTHAFFGGDITSPPNNVAIASVTYQEIVATGYTNGRLEPGETVYVNFNQVLSHEDGVYSEVFFNDDLDNSLKVGDATGEKDAPSGFPLYQADPTEPITTKNPAEKPVFPLPYSGYTTRFAFTYAGSKPYTPSSSFPTVTIQFKRPNPTSSVYVTGWGIQQQTDLSFNSMTALPIPPATPSP